MGWFQQKENMLVANPVVADMERRRAAMATKLWLPHACADGWAAARCIGVWQVEWLLAGALWIVAARRSIAGRWWWARRSKDAAARARARGRGEAGEM